MKKETNAYYKCKKCGRESCIVHLDKRCVFCEGKDMPNLSSKTKEQTDYLFNQIEPFLNDSLDAEDTLEMDKDVKKIIYKTLKVFNQER